MTTLEKNVLFIYAILQEYDNETEKVGPFNQPYLMATQVTECYRVFAQLRITLTEELLS